MFRSGWLRLRSAVSRRWWSFGVELEGGWDVRPPVPGSFARDGSVAVSGRFYVGEYRSPVFRSVQALAEWISAAYPQHVDGSCGLHVHVRGPWDLVSGLSVPDAQRAFLDSLEEWGNQWGVRSERFYDRIHGRNRYCCGVQEGYDLINAAVSGSKGEWRYRAINFASGWHGPGRFEVRVLPMFKAARVAVAAVEAVLELTLAQAKLWGGSVFVVGPGFDGNAAWEDRALVRELERVARIQVRALRDLCRGGGACV